MKKVLQVLILFSFSLQLFSCREETNPCLLSKEVLADIQTLDSLVKIPKIKLRDKEWMKNNYNEPSLLDSKKETYRFILSSSFDTTEIERIEDIGGRYKMTKKIYATHADTVGVASEFEISQSDWNNIVTNLVANNFWTYPTSDNRKGLDGATWVLEGYKPTKDKCTLKNYHRIGRWSPNDTTFIAMCKLFYDQKGK